MLLLKIIILFMIGVSWFASYKIWELNKDKYIMEADIIHSIPIEFSINGVWIKGEEMI